MTVQAGDWVRVKVPGYGNTNRGQVTKVFEVSAEDAGTPFMPPKPGTYIKITNTHDIRGTYPMEWAEQVEPTSCVVCHKDLGCSGWRVGRKATHGDKTGDGWWRHPVPHYGIKATGVYCQEHIQPHIDEVQAKVERDMARYREATAKARDYAKRSDEAATRAVEMRADGRWSRASYWQNQSVAYADEAAHWQKEADKVG
jgi:hypothetical protein